MEYFRRGHSRESGNPFARRCCGESPHARHPGEGRDPLLVVIPAEAGIHFDLAVALLFGAAARTDSRPCAFRRPSLVAGYFLLLAQKKVTKEKGTLASAVCRASCPANFASRLRGSLRGHPCPLRERSRIHARARVRSTRLILRLLAAAERDPGRAKSAAVPAAEAGHRSKATRTNIPSSPRKRGPSAFAYCSRSSNPSKAAAK